MTRHAYSEIFTLYLGLPANLDTVSLQGTLRYGLRRSKTVVATTKAILDAHTLLGT